MATPVMIGILIGIIIGLFVSLDFILVKKRTWYGFPLRGLSISLILNIPQVINVLGSGQNLVLRLLCEALPYTLLTFITSIILGIIVSYYFYNKLKTDYKDIFSREVITYMDLFHNGYGGLKENIRQGLSNAEKKKEKDHKTLLKTMHYIGDDVPEFLIEAYTLAITVKEPLSYTVTVLESFVSKFLSTSLARFTIREYNRETRTMVTLRTTKDEVPSPIPIDKTNMITKSMEMKMPLIYSQNKKFHFDTGNSVKERKYIDYVTYCLLTDASGKVPLFSVNLDVKDIETQKKMFAFVNTKIFQVVCEPIKIRLKEYAERRSYCD